MLESFVLVLTLCGTLYNGNHHCEQFVLDSDKSEIQCLNSIVDVYNRKPSPLHGLINDASNDWFKAVELIKFECITEEKE